MTKPGKSKIPNAVNIPLLIAHHVLNKGHSMRYRAGIGVVMMISGVLIAEGVHSTYVIINITKAAFGWLVHAMGTLPIVQIIEGIGEHMGEEIRIAVDESAPPATALKEDEEEVSHSLGAEEEQEHLAV